MKRTGRGSNGKEREEGIEVWGAGVRGGVGREAALGNRIKVFFSQHDGRAFGDR